MRYRRLGGTDIEVSEVGFGVWTVSAGWWGDYTDELAADLLRKALDHVAVVISDKGRRHRAYGIYQGDTSARDDYPDRIVIFRDTLLRDFGHDPDELRAQVTRTVRHELAHHLGADELGVRELGP